MPAAPGGRFASPKAFSSVTATATTPQQQQQQQLATAERSARRSASASARCQQQQQQPAPRTATPTAGGHATPRSLDNRPVFDASPGVSQQKLLDARKGRARNGLLVYSMKTMSGGGSTAATVRNGSPMARAKDDWMRTELKRLEKINRERLQAHVEGLRGRQSPLIIPVGGSGGGGDSTPTPSSSDEPCISYPIASYLPAPRRVEQLPRNVYRHVGAQQQQQLLLAEQQQLQDRSASNGSGGAPSVSPIRAVSVSPPRAVALSARGLPEQQQFQPYQQQQAVDGSVTAAAATPKPTAAAASGGGASAQQFRIKWTPIKSSLPSTHGASPMSLVSLEANLPPTLSGSASKGGRPQQQPQAPLSFLLVGATPPPRPAQQQQQRSAVSSEQTPPPPLQAASPSAAAPVAPLTQPAPAFASSATAPSALGERAALYTPRSSALPPLGPSVQLTAMPSSGASCLEDVSPESPDFGSRRRGASTDTDGSDRETAAVAAAALMAEPVAVSGLSAPPKLLSSAERHDSTSRGSSMSRDRAAPFTAAGTGGAAESAAPKFCWECGSRYPKSVSAKFCVVCGARVAVQ